MIDILGDALENFADKGKNDETSAEEEVPAGEAAAEEAALPPDKMLQRMPRYLPTRC